MIGILEWVRVQKQRRVFHHNRREHSRDFWNFDIRWREFRLKVNGTIWDASKTLLRHASYNFLSHEESVRNGTVLIFRRIIIQSDHVFLANQMQ